VIRLETGDAVFVYRVAGVALAGDRVLLHRAEPDDFWSLPGGRVELMEFARDALRREMLEESGEEVRVERLLWVVEEFFEWNGRPHHELALYFLMTFPPGSRALSSDTFVGAEQDLPLVFRWHRLADLDGLTVYPVFLKERLQRLSPAPEHVVDCRLPTAGPERSE
jgi:ADP-ribose pyrophosphatase YjhB (NUDIX family)